MKAKKTYIEATPQTKHFRKNNHKKFDRFYTIIRVIIPDYTYFYMSNLVYLYLRYTYKYKSLITFSNLLNVIFD